MAKRLPQEDAQALLNLRTSLIRGYQSIIDEGAPVGTAMCKQSDVANVLTMAIKGLEEILATAADVQFK